jgi:thiol-disulfide isomerase/thioredoxin
LREEYGVFEREFIKQSDDYVATHPKSFIATLIIQGMLNSMNLDLKKVTKYYNALDQSLKDTKTGKSIKTKLDQLGAPISAKSGTEIGSIALDFSAPNPEGKIIALKESLGKVTLIDFWASWCGPCRAENPNVVALYNEFHAKGFNIIGVSLDKDAAKWKEAISKDKLTWNQISNLKFWEEPIAVTYGVQSIPATYLLDASGKIIAKDLRGADLRNKISSLLDAK